MKKLILSLIGLITLSSLLAQVPAGRLDRTTLFKEYKRGVVTKKNGRQVRQSQLNIFLKKSTLVFIQGATVMEAMMPDIKSVEIEGRTFINYGDCLYEVLASDSVADAVLVCQRTIDIESWKAEVMNAAIIDNLEYSVNSRAINMTVNDDLVNKESYPIIDTYSFLIRGKMVRAEERTVRGMLNRKKREEMDAIGFYEFRWSDPNSLAKLLPLFRK